MNYLLICGGLCLLLASLSCGSPSAVPQKSASSSVQSSPSLNKSEDEPVQINDLFVKGERLSFNGYEVARLKKVVNVAHQPRPIDASYAVLKKDGRVLAKFDGLYSGFGNATDFGLFAFLGGEARQLTVSQTIPRGGRHWVVNLSPAFSIIYDSLEWGVGREDLRVLDLDKDGMYEIIQEVTAFYGFDKFTSEETPLPLIVFKYDGQVGKYLPANHGFQNYVFREIEGEIRSLNPNDGSEYLSKMLDIALRYIYAGKEQEAWSFFDQEYQLPDKEDVKTKVRAVLRKQPVWRFIYAKRIT